MRHLFRLNLLAAALFALSATAQPKLLVGIVIDNFSLDNLETNFDVMSPDGFRKLWDDGCVYTNGSYCFDTPDRSSATATVYTGSTPYYHGIVSNRFLERKSLRVMPTVDAGILTTTLSDELKAATRGSGYVLSVAADRDMALIGGGHAPNTVLWWNGQSDGWDTSTSVKVPVWADALSRKDDVNDAVTALAVAALSCTPLGLDAKPDMLCVGLHAHDGNYRDLDFNVSTLLKGLEERCGKDGFLVFLTSTSVFEPSADASYALPASVAVGELHTERIVTMLNMYLGAIYGKENYVEGSYLNHLFLNRDLLERRQIRQSELYDRCTEFLCQMSGIKRVYPCTDLLSGTAFKRVIDGYHSERSGDIVLEIAPGWTLVDDRWGEQETFDRSTERVPIIFYGSSVRAAHIEAPVTTDAVAPTLAKLIKVRTPNGCAAFGLGL